MPQRSRPQFREADLLERDVRQIKYLCSSRFMLAIDPVLKVLVRRGGDAVFGLGEKFGPLAEDNGTRWTDSSTGRLLVVVQAVIAKLTFDDLGIPIIPLELGNIEGTSHLAVAAANAEGTIPCNRTPVGFF